MGAWQKAFCRLLGVWSANEKSTSEVNDLRMWMASL